MDELTITNESDIQSKIFTICGTQVMFDIDLVELYGVETKNLNRNIKRNIGCFNTQCCFEGKITKGTK